MMDLGQDAYVAASHTVVVLAILLAYIRVTELHADMLGRVVFLQSSWTHWAARLVLATLIVERLYYVAARMLVDRGVDLWVAHPAPAGLALMVAAAAYAVGGVKVMVSMVPRVAVRVVSIDVLALLSVWLLVAVLLH